MILRYTAVANDYCYDKTHSYKMYTIMLPKVQQMLAIIR